MDHSNTLLFSAIAAASTLAALPGISHAHSSTRAQVCSLGTAGVGQPATLICKNVSTGATTQSVPVGNTVSAAGGVGGNLSRHGDRVLVTNQAGGALLFKEDDGRLRSPVTLQTDGEGSLSGTLSRRGAYVLTGTRLRFFPHGRTAAASSQPLLRGDGSASQVTLAGDYAYVAEKAGSLEAFLLGRDGNIVGPATPVGGIPAGVIVGITGHDDLVVAPVAHLASNFAQAAIPVVAGLDQVQLVPTKEVAACWAANDDGEVCVSNPGSMTVSCGRLTDGGFKSYTSAAANPVGEAVFDLDVRDGMVGIQATRSGAPVLQTYGFVDDDGDFLSLISEYPIGSAAATGALLLPPIH
jgi:hypothetical protein